MSLPPPTMTSMDRPAVDHAIADGRWQELTAWLSSMSDDERTAARRLYRSTWRAAARRAVAEFRPGGARMVQLALAIGLSETPEEASTNCRWAQDAMRSRSAAGLPVLVALLRTRGEAWSLSFALRAASVEMRGDAARRCGEMAALVLPAFGRSDAPLPEGAIIRGWADIVASASYKSRSADGTWEPAGLTSAGPEGEQFAYAFPTRLVEVWEATPRLPDVLTAGLRTPEALSPLGTLEGEHWDLAEGVRHFIAEGLLPRGELIDECLAALTRTDRPRTQGVYAALLRGTDFAGADAEPRLPLVAHILPTVHGSVTAVLLPAVLDMDPPDDVLLDVGAVVLARREKAQKRLLVAHLARRALTPAAEALLAMAAADPDAAFAASARRLIDADAPEDLPTVTEVGPSLVEEGRAPGPPLRWSADAAGLDAAWSDSRVRVRITSDAAALDLVVRLAKGSVADVRQTFMEGAKGEVVYSAGGNRVLPHVRMWCEGGQARRSYVHTWTTRTQAGGQWEEKRSSGEFRPPPHDVFTDRLVEETIERLGTVAELLSTPSFSDGSISVDDLAQRLERAGRQGVGAYDLVQALLRLEPTRTEQAGRFASISASIGARRRWSFSRGGLDAGTVIASWIRAGGLPDKPVRIDATGVHLEAVRLPLPPSLLELEGVRELCEPAHLIGRESGRSTMAVGMPQDIASFLGVVPFWADAAAALLEKAGVGDSIYLPRMLPFFVGGPGRFGAMTHRLFARQLSHPRGDGRLVTVEAMTDAAVEGRLDRLGLRDATIAMLDEGAGSVSRLADSWTNGARAGLLPWLWPAMADTLRWALARDRAPAGLADLLRAVGGVIAAVEDRDGVDRLIAEVRPLAEQRSRSRAAHEARALLAAAGSAV